MFEGLDKIDWKNVGYHIWGKSDDYLGEIPEKIRSLNSLNEEIQDSAMSFLFGEKGTFGMICDTTPYIVPFVIELLGNPGTPKRNLIFYYLSRVMEYVLSSGSLTVREMRLHLSVYNSFAKNIHILTGLLDDEEQAIRLDTIELLGTLTDEAEMLLPEFFERFHLETDEDLQVALLNSIKLLLSSLDAWTQSQLKEKYAPVLRDIVDSRPAHKVQLAAARASVETINRYRKDKNVLSGKVPDLLAREFTYYSGGKPDIYWSYLKNKLNYSALIIRDLAQLGYEPFLTMLENPENTALQVHLIIRGLFASVLMSSENTTHWESTLSHTKEGIYYLPNYRMDDYRVVIRWKDKIGLMKQVLQLAIDNEKVWELPTNIFSFFFGLPDSRNELQKMLDDVSSA
jgi:hypothetical protein